MKIANIGLFSQFKAPQLKVKVGEAKRKAPFSTEASVPLHEVDRLNSAKQKPDIKFDVINSRTNNFIAIGQNDELRVLNDDYSSFEYRHRDESTITSVNFKTAKNGEKGVCSVGIINPYFCSWYDVPCSAFYKTISWSDKENPEYKNAQVLEPLDKDVLKKKLTMFQEAINTPKLCANRKFKQVLPDVKAQLGGAINYLSE